MTNEVLTYAQTNGVAIPKISEPYRNYRVFRNQNGMYIINTWLSKGYSLMDVPTSISYEKVLISVINKMKNNCGLSE